MPDQCPFWWCQVTFQPWFFQPLASRLLVDGSQRPNVLCPTQSSGFASLKGLLPHSWRAPQRDREDERQLRYLKLRCNHYNYHRRHHHHHNVEKKELKCKQQRAMCHFVPSRIDKTF
jgi:hypothetical protein